MKTTLSRRRDIAFILSRNDINSIVKVFADYSVPLDIRVECGDALTLEPASVEELFDISNFGERKITQLRFGEHGFPGINCDLRFELSRYSPVRLDVEGQDDKASAMFRKLLLIVDSTRQPYTSIIIPSSFTPLITAAASVATSIMILGDWTGRGPHVSTWLPLTTWLVALRTPIYKYFFPVGIFEIGKGMDEKSKFAGRRNVILVCGALALIVGLLVSWLSHKFSI